MKSFYIAIFLFLQVPLFGQNPALDRLEMLYDQGNYKIVYRKSDRLLDKPDFDFSLIPGYYRAIATLQLAQDAHWRKKKKLELSQAFAALYKLRQTEKGQMLIRAHIYEISYLKKDLDAWLSNETSLTPLENTAWKEFILQFFSDLKLIESDQSNPDFHFPNRPELKERLLIIESAKKQLGVPYVTGGIDPSGFDCSGFTRFVLAQNNIEIPRRAKDQFASAKKIDPTAVQAGDLVFFSNGGEVNHVGIIISDQGDPKMMIHASSSKGISITEIANSTYWSPRIVGYGSFLGH